MAAGGSEGYVLARDSSRRGGRCGQGRGDTRNQRFFQDPSSASGEALEEFHEGCGAGKHSVPTEDHGNEMKMIAS